MYRTPDFPASGPPLVAPTTEVTGRAPTVARESTPKTRLKITGRSANGRVGANGAGGDRWVATRKHPAPAAAGAVAVAQRPSLPAPTFLRLSAGFIYFYFGFLKFFPDLSPAELLASQTLMRLSMSWLDAATALWWLAVMECVIGMSFLFNVGMRYIFFLFLAHQISTFVPLFMYPELTFKFAPFAPTMEGQYIFKNLISIAAGWTVMLPSVKAAWRKEPPTAPTT